MPYSANVPAAGSPPSTPPAPWVPFTRAGCNVGDVSTANMVLENTNPDLANFFGPNSPEVQQLNADTDSFKDQETNDYLGLGVHCAQGASFCADAEAVKFGQTTPSHTAVTDSLPDEPGGYGTPNQPFQALFGHKYLTSQLSAAANSGGNRVVNGDSYPIFDAQGNLTDLNGNTMRGAFPIPPGNTNFTPGFPGFGPISAAQTLAYTADMLETGVPVVYGYISDAHEKKTAGGNAQTGCTNPSTSSSAAQGPADPCYKATLASYNASFAKFFQRLADDGITPSNTVFMFSAEEGDHFAGANVGRSVQPNCTGTPGTIDYTCSYATGAQGRHDRRAAVESTGCCSMSSTTRRRSTTSRRATPSSSRESRPDGSDDPAARAGLRRRPGLRQLRQRDGEPHAVRGGPGGRTAFALRERRPEPDAVLHRVPEGRLLPVVGFE